MADFVTSCNAANAANIALSAVSIAANAAAESLDGGDDSGSGDNSNDGMRVVTSAGMIALSWVGLAITVFCGGF
jgi:hypothetical protein